jgi:hypothetical protein
MVPVDAAESTGIHTTATTPAPATDDDGDDAADESESEEPRDIGGGPDDECGDHENPCPLDILVVVDNSSTMGDPQVALTRALVQLVGRLERFDGYPFHAVDVQMMFTTTDMGSPLCEQYQKRDYTPALGAPISSGCNARIDRFTGIGTSPVVRTDVCTDLCPSDLTPADPFVAFSAESANVADGPAVDVDGDGVADSRAAQAVACLAPQGIDGCGYEQPLETMAQALDPGAAWNNGNRPFLRPGSMVLIVVATDEMDCSTDDPELVLDPTYWETSPGSGTPQPSSALCWNAGMACGQTGPDGIYPDCVTTDAPMQPLSRYTNYLLGDLDDHEVRMIAVTGVPLVTEYSPDPPFQPITGGVASLVLREWRDGVFPRGDLVPQDLEDGVEVEDKTYLYKAGPGCTEPVGDTGRFVQAIPNPRVNQVCASIDDPAARPRCCVESICDPAPAMSCVEGWFHDSPGGDPPG